MISVAECADGSNPLYNDLLKNLGEERIAHTWLNHLRKFIGASDAVVELGAGYGNLAIPLWRNGLDVAAIDRNNHALSYIADQTAGSVTVFCRDFCKDPLPDFSNLYLLRSCVINIIDRKSCFLLFDNLSQCLKKDGVFIFEIFREEIMCDRFFFENDLQTMQLKRLTENTFKSTVFHKHLNIRNVEVVRSVGIDDIRSFIGQNFCILDFDYLTPLTINYIVKRL